MLYAYADIPLIALTRSSPLLACYLVPHADQASTNQPVNAPRIQAALDTTQVEDIKALSQAASQSSQERSCEARMFERRRLVALSPRAGEQAGGRNDRPAGRRTKSRPRLITSLSAGIQLESGARAEDG